MLKRMTIKKILVSTSVLFALTLLYLIPDYKKNILNPKQSLTYVDTEIVKNEIFLLDNNNYVSRALVPIDSDLKDTVKVVKEMLDILICDGAGESKIPSGFKCILSNDTVVRDIMLQNGVMKVNFSEDVLNVKEEYEEKIIEAIVYTLTSLKEVKKVMIHIDGEILNCLPKSGKILPSTLDRSFGVNKLYDFTDVHDITSVTVYYIKDYNNEFYYVPVTKYVNDKREKINIVIDELESSYIYNTNLMSFLNDNSKLLSVVEEEEILKLEFNDAIFSDILNKDILEEVKYTIFLSAIDNYNIKTVIFEVDGEEIYRKSIE